MNYHLVHTYYVYFPLFKKKEVIITMTGANLMHYPFFPSQGLYEIDINILILQISKLCQTLLVVSQYVFSHHIPPILFGNLVTSNKSYNSQLSLKLGVAMCQSSNQ